MIVEQRACNRLYLDRERSHLGSQVNGKRNKRPMALPGWAPESSVHH